MSTYLNQQWLDENEQRNYPLDSLATLIDDQGNNLPNEIITDLRVLFDRKLGDGAYISSIMVSELLVTVTIVAVETDPFIAQGEGDDIVTGDLGIQPLAVVQASRREAGKGQTFKLEPLQDGVAGWISFGQGISQTGTWAFSSATQSCLHARAYSRIDYGGVTTVGPDTSTLTLDGLVKILGRSGVQTEIATRDIYSDDTLVEADATCLIINLDTANPTNFALLAGECGVRPDSDNCGKEGIRFFASVAPDVNGNINLLFDPYFVGYPIQYKDEEGYEDYTEYIGLALELRLGEDAEINIEDLCGTREPRINPDGTFPGDTEGECNADPPELPDIESCFCEDVGADTPLQMDIWHQPDVGDPVLETILMLYSGTGPGDRYRAFTEINPPGDVREVYVHCAIGAWQMLEDGEYRVFWFGSMDSQCEDVREGIEEDDITYTVSIGPQLEIDSDEDPIAPAPSLYVTQNFGVAQPIVGTYCRKYRGRYEMLGNPAYELRISLEPGPILGIMRYQFYENGVPLTDQTGILERGEVPERFVSVLDFPVDTPAWSVVIRSHHVGEGPCS
jgi:hypothetical protein